MHLLESFRTHSIWNLEIYGHCIMEAESFYPETTMNARDTFAVSIARHQPPGMQEPPKWEPTNQ